jgi:cytochrome P450
MSETTTPPTAEGVPLLGNGLAFSRAPFEAVEAWASHGDVVRVRFPGRSIYLVTRPDLVEEVLVEKRGRFTIGRDQRETFDGIEDDAVSAATGDRWARLRRALRPAFTRERIESYGGRMAERTAAHVDEWDDGERIDLHGEMRRLTLRILADTLLGTNVEGREGVIMDAADALVDRADPRRVGQLLPDWLPTPTERRFQRRVAALDDYVEGVLAAAPDEGDGDDVRSVLLAARDRGELTTAEVEDNLVGLLLAGHDSSAVALTYAWYELSRRPETAQSLVAEVDETVGDGLPDAGDVDALERVRRVVRETLRLYPPVWAVNREATAPVTLGVYDLPAGAQLTIPQWVVHRDDRFWDRPETFDPDRWADEVGEPSEGDGGDRAGRPEYAYFPFGGGPRHCIGIRFAHLELTTALAAMVARVDLDVTTDGPLAFRPSLSLRPTVDLEATVRRR